MRTWNWVAAAMAAMALTACGGGGGNAGTSPFTGTTTVAPVSSPASAAPSAASLEVLASAVQLGSGGDTATITATAKDAGNSSITSAPVVFTTTSGTLTSAASVTSTAGTATATLAAGADRSNRTVTVTATSGTVSGSVQVLISGTTLAYSGATTIPLGQAQTLTVKLTDSKSVAIAGVAISVASSLNNGLASRSITTDSQGVATVAYTATNAGVDVLTFSGAGATVSSSIQISGENFAFVTPAVGTLIPVGTSPTVTVKYLLGGAPVAGRRVNFAVTAGNVSTASVLTDVTGQASTTVTSTTSSPATIQASLLNAAGTTVVAQASVAVSFVAVTPSKLVLQVTPTAIAPNGGTSTTNQAQVIATVTDATGNPVQGTTVNFSRTADPSGGNLNQASAVTNSSGQASVQYVAGGSSTASNGVKLHAIVASAPNVIGDSTLTVNQTALFIALGTGNVISNIDAQTYKKDWVVYVTDANGVAVPNVSLTMKVLPLVYGKGSLVYGTTWAVTPTSAVFCANEDINYNGALDSGEDTNNDGKLEPGNVISVTPGVVTTDSTGRATVSLIYAESYAPWVQVRLVAQAVVAGTESSTSSTFFVTGAASDFSDATVPPAGLVSPFGTTLSCTAPN